MKACPFEPAYLLASPMRGGERRGQGWERWKKVKQRPSQAKVKRGVRKRKLKMDCDWNKSAGGL